ncbi:MAG: hypothetical protein AAF750_04725 [Planctomycetota bacterium]
MAFSSDNPDDPSEAHAFAMAMGPGQIDTLVRNALQNLWMVLPREKQNVEDVEREFRRLVDRALRDLREDDEAFGTGGE